MSDEREAMIRDAFNSVPDMGGGLDVVYSIGFDAGRASRDAEVDAAGRENEALWDNLNERDGELSDTTTRADAAEAVIARVNAWGEDFFGPVRWCEGIELEPESGLNPYSHPEPTEEANRSEIPNSSTEEAE